MGVWKDYLPEEIQIRSRESLDILNRVGNIEDLERDAAMLVSEESGYYSLQINEKWRIVFQWDGMNAQNVQLRWG